MSMLDSGYGSPQFASLARNQNALTSAYRRGVRQARRRANLGGKGAADAAEQEIKLLQQAQAQGINATGMGSYEEKVAGLNKKFSDMSEMGAAKETLRRRAIDGALKEQPTGAPGAAPTQTGEDKGTKINLGASPKKGVKDAMAGTGTGATPAPGSYEARAAALKDMEANDINSTANRGVEGDIFTRDQASRNVVAMSEQNQAKDQAFEIGKAAEFGKAAELVTTPEQTASASAALSSNGGDGNLRTDATPGIAKAADNKQENPIKDAINKEASGRRAPRLEATPEGMELVGMKSGVPQYLPINEVYGDQAKGMEQAGPNQDATKAGLGVKNLTDEQVRNEYQTKASTPEAQAGAQKMMEDTNVLPQSRKKPTALPVPRGPASQPERVAPEGYVGRSQRETWDMENANAKAIKDQEAKDAEMAKRGLNPDGTLQTREDVAALAEAADKKKKRPGSVFNS